MLAMMQRSPKWDYGQLGLSHFPTSFTGFDEGHFVGAMPVQLHGRRNVERPYGHDTGGPRPDLASGWVRASVFTVTPTSSALRDILRCPACSVARRVTHWVNG